MEDQATNPMRMSVDTPTPTAIHPVARVSTSGTSRALPIRARRATPTTTSAAITTITTSERMNSPHVRGRTVAAHFPSACR
jgi:hypothetical protein